MLTHWKGALFWLAMLVYAVFLFWLGMRAERARTVQRENTVLSQQINDARAATRALHEATLNLQAEHVHSIERLNAIVMDWEDSREQQHQFFNQQKTALAALLDTRPDLHERAGADVLRHWQASNAGPGHGVADAAAPADAAGVDAAMSGIADAERRALGEPDSKPRRGDGALSPVPGIAAPFERGGEGVGAGGSEGVLHGTQANADRNGELR